MDPTALALDPQRLERLTATIEADIAAERYDGAVSLVARHGQIVLHEARGLAERSSGRAARTDDVFHLFSVTKTFTATAVLQQVAAGTLSLDDTIGDVLPDLAEELSEIADITVEQLLAMESGIPEYEFVVMPDVLAYKPGTKASYRVGSLNGRPLHDDAMNTVLELMHGVAIDDHANDGRRYETTFPYIVQDR